MKKAEFILTTIIGTILLWVTVFLTIDIFNFLDDKETYSKVHHLDMNKKGFEWDYLQRNILLISIGLLGLIIIGLRFTKPNNNGIKKMNFGLIGLILLTATIKLVRLLMGTSNNSVFKNQFGDKFIWSRYFIQKKLSRCFFDVFRPHCGLNIIKWTHLSREGF